MSLKRAWRAAMVAGVVCLAGLATSAAAAASATVAWGTTISAPAGTLANLFGVAASSSSDVLAVGGYNPGESPTALLTRPYAEHRSEEHTSELQSRPHLVCRLLLEKKKS